MRSLSQLQLVARCAWCAGTLFSTHYRKTYIQDKNNTVWEATLNIAESKNGEKILYDIVSIKENTGLAFDLNQKARGRHNAAMQSSASADSIRNPGEKVNRKISKQERGASNREILATALDSAAQIVNLYNLMGRGEQAVRHLTVGGIVAHALCHVHIDSLLRVRHLAIGDPVKEKICRAGGQLLAALNARLLQRVFQRPRDFLFEAAGGCFHRDQTFKADLLKQRFKHTRHNAVHNGLIITQAPLLGLYR